MSEPLSEPAFDRIADEALSRLVDALSAREDFEVDLAMGVLTIQFEDGKRYIVNSHRAARQIWLAAESSAWHFDWDGSAWISTKTKDELWTLLEDLISKRSGDRVKLR